MKYSTRILGALAALLLSLPSHAQLYPLFGPANGVLKGSTASPQTTTAAGTDVASVFTGTCNSSTFLRGDGACGTPAGTGVSSLTSGTGITLTPSTITTTGSIALTSPVSAANGGTGEAGTITGVLKGNGTSAYTAAASSDVIGLWTGTCNSGTFLRADGSCQAPGGSAGGANPSAVIGLTAVNGVAATFMTSDSAPALSQGITPTWTNTHTWNLGVANSVPIQANNTSAATNAATSVAMQNNASDLFELTLTGGAYSSTWLANGLTGETANIYTFSGGPPLQIGTNGKARATISTIGTWNFLPQDSTGASNFTFTGLAGNNAVNIVNTNTASTSFGLSTQAGTNSSDYSISAKSAGGTGYFMVRGDGAISGYGQTSASLLRMDPDTQQPTVTLTGCTATVTGTAIVTKMGNLVTIALPNITCTSNATTMQLTGMSANFQPTHTQALPLAYGCLEDNSASITNTGGVIMTGASPTITLTKAGVNTWTSSGVKGMLTVCSFTYTLN